MSLRWSVSGGDWIGKSVSLGELGTQLFTGIKTQGNVAQLFSVFDAGAASPVWSDGTSLYSFDDRVDSAARRDVHARLHFVTAQLSGPRTPVLAKYDSGSAVPLWEYTFPVSLISYDGGALVSGDGDVTVGWVWDASQTDVLLAVFTTDSGQPDTYVALHTSGEPRGVLLSDDGSTVYISSALRTFLVDTQTGAVVYQHTNWTNASYGHAISPDATTFALSTVAGGVRVLRKQGSSYAEVFSYLEPWPTWCMNVALSEDGQTLAATFDDTNTLLDVRLRVFDLAQPQGALVYATTISGSGTLDNMASDLALSASGETLALGLWGDEAGLAPEVQLFAKPQGIWGRVGTYDLPGSVQDVDLSADGRWLAVGSKAVHNNTFAGGGRIDLFETGISDLTLHGVPSIGNTVTLEHRLAPGALSRSVRAGAPQTPPIPFPNTGMLYIDRSDLVIFAADTADGTGVARTSYSIPNDPNLIGTTVWFQSFQSSPRRLSQDYVKMTILP